MTTAREPAATSFIVLNLSELAGFSREKRRKEDIGWTQFLAYDKETCHYLELQQVARTIAISQAVPELKH